MLHCVASLSVEDCRHRLSTGYAPEAGIYYPQGHQMAVGEPEEGPCFQHGKLYIETSIETKRDSSRSHRAVLE